MPNIGLLTVVVVGTSSSPGLGTTISVNPVSPVLLLRTCRCVKGPQLGGKELDFGGGGVKGGGGGGG